MVGPIFIHKSIKIKGLGKRIGFIIPAYRTVWNRSLYHTVTVGTDNLTTAVGAKPSIDTAERVNVICLSFKINK